MRKRPEDQEASNRTSISDSSDQQEEEVEEERGEKPRHQIKETHLFEVAFKNRVVKRSPLVKVPRFSGRQGTWYPEECLVIACDEREVRDLISEELELRPILGVSGFKRRQLKREIKIKKIRRLD